MSSPSFSRTGSGAPGGSRHDRGAANGDIPAGRAGRGTSRRGKPEGSAGRRHAADDQATELLLAFGRLLRGHRHGDGLPARLEHHVASGHLARRHVGALAVVALYGPLTVSELANREGLALSTASLMVTQLSQAGLVERREDTHDRRCTVVSVAREHRRESEAAIETKLAPLRRALARMGTRRAAALLEGLSILVEEISGTAAPHHQAAPASSAANGARPHPHRREEDAG